LVRFAGVSNLKPQGFSRSSIVRVEPAQTALVSALEPAARSAKAYANEARALRTREEYTKQ
jgi:hypothetical protein